MSIDWTDPEAWDTEFFPGSSKPIVRHKNRAKEEKPKLAKEDSWDKPRVMNLDGKEVEFFTVGQLARALGDRQAVTIRSWEANGIIPKAKYWAASTDARGRRRLYTRELLNGMVRIAREEGILEKHGKAIKDTNFTARVVELYGRLGAAE